MVCAGAGRASNGGPCAAGPSGVKTLSSSFTDACARSKARSCEPATARATVSSEGARDAAVTWSSQSSAGTAAVKPFYDRCTGSLAAMLRMLLQLGVPGGWRRTGPVVPTSVCWPDLER